MYTFDEEGKSGQKLHTFNCTKSDLQCYSIVYSSSFSELKEQDGRGKTAHTGT